MKKLNLRRRSLIVAALLAAVSVGAGTAGTVAFFQSNHTFDISVEAATVDVEQGKPEFVSKNVTYGDVVVNDDGSVGATSLVPGDTFLLKVSYVNHSNIGVKYRVSAQVPTGFTAEFFTDDACTIPATDTSYTELAKGGTVEDHYVKVTVTDDLKEGYTGKITVGVDAVQDNVDTATLFGKELEAGGTVDLAEDLSVTNPADSIFNVTADTVINLNGKTLTLDAQKSLTALSVQNGKTLTLKNGKVKTTGNRADYALIQALGADLVLDNVNYTAENGSAIFYKGSGSHVTINNSTISVKNGYYAVTTNASSAYGDQSDSSVTITGSTLTVTNDGKEEEKGDCAALYLNVGGKYRISDSTITGQRFGALIRSGDLTLNNVTINKTETVDLGYVKKADSGTFGSGTEVAQGALFLGNGSSGNYTAPSKVTFAGPVTFEGKGPAIVASGSTTQDVDLETGTNYKGDVKVYDFREKGDTHTFKINGTDLKIGDYTHDGTSKYTIA